MSENRHPSRCRECEHYTPNTELLKGVCENGWVSARSVGANDPCHDPAGWMASQDSAGERGDATERERLLNEWMQLADKALELTTLGESDGEGPDAFDIVNEMQHLEWRWRRTEKEEQR